MAPKKKAPGGKRDEPDDRSSWTEGEQHWDRIAAANGIQPMPEDLSLLARVTPEAAADLLDAARQVRADDAVVRRRRQRRKTQAS